VIVISLCVIVLYRLRWKLNVLAQGDDAARALGLNTSRLRKSIIIASTLITAISVCQCGMIGWIGVVVPQIVRMFVGPDMRRLVPISFFYGGIFLALSDLLCKTLLPTKIPIGILTSLLGTPVYLLMLRHAKKGWT
jgi:iron complex transport system permease protein